MDCRRKITIRERKVAMKLENLISTTQELTLGLPESFVLSPVLYNDYPKGGQGSEQQ